MYEHYALNQSVELNLLNAFVCFIKFVALKFSPFLMLSVYEDYELNR
jgi:hypothetical protein